MIRHALALATMASLAFTQALAAQETADRPVLLMEVSAGSADVTRQFFGHVVARQTVDLAFQVGGQIIEFPAQEGEVIAEGSLIAELDLRAFQLQVDQARLQLDQAERALRRLQQLTVSVTEVQLQDAETQVGLAEVALRNAEIALDDATLLAPFNALVAGRNVANFSTISAGSPIVRVHDMSELRVEIDVPEILFQRAGAAADVSLVAQFPTSDTQYPLEVREFNAEASAVGQSFRLTLALADAQTVQALPGSSVVVFATLHEAAQEIILPPSAVRIANDGSASVLRFVEGENGAGVLEELPVSVAATRDGGISITDGLPPGTEIVRSGAHTLADGQNVRRFGGFSN